MIVDGEEGVDGASSANCDPSPTEICDADGNVIVDGEEGVDGASSANCNDDEDIPVEVAGTTETADPDAEPNVLAITGVSSRVYLLSGLMVAVLGLWFMIAGAWFRPQGHRS